MSANRIAAERGAGSTSSAIRSCIRRSPRMSRFSSFGGRSGA